MQKTIIQVPIDKELRDRATKVAHAEGFTSLQESIRIFLQKFASKELKITYEEPAETLSPRAARRYDKMVRDIESGKEPVYVAHGVKDLMDQLHGRKPPVQHKIPKTL